MTSFGTIPPEPLRQDSLDHCALLFVEAVNNVIRDMNREAIIYETIRTNARQQWLAGFGVEYDDGRGIVTHAQSAQYGWHYFGLAVDIIHATSGWDASAAWWATLARVYEDHGLTAGARWKMADKPHGQWGKCRTTPSDISRTLNYTGGLMEVWKAVGAI